MFCDALIDATANTVQKYCLSVSYTVPFHLATKNILGLSQREAIRAQPFERPSHISGQLPQSILFVVQIRVFRAARFIPFVQIRYTGVGRLADGFAVSALLKSFSAAQGLRGS
jgi:hypothetical protein